MTKPLSPAAQAVLDAANGASSYGPDDCLSDAREIATAAIRALADQVVPAQLGLMHPVARAEAENIRAEILAIVAELEGADG